MPLTDAAIRTAKPGERAVKLFDGGGLYLELAPSGGKWWRLKYRFGGKEKRIGLGVYPTVGLKEARERREHAKKLLSQGIDPSTERKESKAIAIAEQREQENTAHFFNKALYQRWGKSVFRTIFPRPVGP